MAPEELATETCARCGERFGCGATAGSCWCATVDLAPGVAQALDRRYDGCLCPRCLGAAAAGDIIRLSSPPDPGNP